MALDDVQHVEAIAIIKALVELFDPTQSREPSRTALAWCTEQYPSPAAYMAALRARSIPRVADA